MVIPELLDGKYTVTELGANVFRSTSINTIYIPKSVQTIDPLAFECDFLKAITVDEENINYASDDGVLFTKDMKTLVRFPVAYEKEAYSIPYGVEKIGTFSFFGPVSSSNAPTDLKLDFPESVTEICYSAFYGAYISELKLPESVLTMLR